MAEGQQEGHKEDRQRQRSKAVVVSRVKEHPIPHKNYTKKSPSALIPKDPKREGFLSHFENTYYPEWAGGSEYTAKIDDDPMYELLSCHTISDPVHKAPYEVYRKCEFANEDIDDCIKA